MAVSVVASQGFLRFITGESPEAKLLRSRLVFKIIPMLNPDGVIAGNYRCSLMGVDLNRRWDDANKFMYPTIHAAKSMLTRFSAQRKVLLFCDLHGHSRRFNIFIYGCAPPGTPALEAARARLFPHLLFKESPAVFPSQILSRTTVQALAAKSRPTSANALSPTRTQSTPQSPSGLPSAQSVVMELQNGRFSFADCCFEVQDSKRSTGSIVIDADLCGPLEELVACHFRSCSTHCGMGRAGYRQRIHTGGVVLWRRIQRCH